MTVKEFVAIEAGVDMSDQGKLLYVLRNNEFKFAIKQGTMMAYVNDTDVTERIRQPEVTAEARHIASAAKLRQRLVQMQREFAAGQEKIVTEGRDQGTVAFGNADIKFNLTAEIGERARRRQAQLQAKDTNESLEQIRRTIEERDKSDETRADGPLKPADDAIIVDTTNLSIEEVVEKLLSYVKQKCLKRH